MGTAPIVGFTAVHDLHLYPWKRQPAQDPVGHICTHPACPRASCWHRIPAQERGLQWERMEIAQHRGHCWAGKWGIKRNLWVSRSLLGTGSWSRLWTISGMNRLRMKLLPLLPSSSVCCQPKVGSASRQSCSGAREKWEQQNTAKQGNIQMPTARIVSS